MFSVILNLVYSIVCCIFVYIPVVVNNIDQISIIECQEAKDLKEMMILIVLHAGRLRVPLRHTTLQHHWIRMLFVTWLNNSIFANLISSGQLKKELRNIFQIINAVIYTVFSIFLRFYITVFILHALFAAISNAFCKQCMQIKCWENPWLWKCIYITFICILYIHLINLVLRIFLFR